MHADTTPKGGTRLRTLIVLFLSLSRSACAISATSPRWATGNWPPDVPPGLVVIESSLDKPSCTGAVVANADATAYVLTAGHCVGRVSRHRALARYVAVPERQGQTYVWRHLEVARVMVPPATSKRTHRERPSWSIDDWAILAIRSPSPLPVMKVARPETAANLPPTAPVTLVSFFDWHYDTMYPHEHEFLWGSYSNDVVKAGHSGAPVLLKDALIAVFSGGRPPDPAAPEGASATLTFTSLETVVTEAASCGFAIGADGVVQVSSKSGPCWSALAD